MNGKSNIDDQHITQFKKATDDDRLDPCLSCNDLFNP